MKKLYVPAGETAHYNTLTTDLIVVDGCLEVTNTLTAKQITGKGLVKAHIINTDTMVVDDVECASLHCESVMAKRLEAMEIFASNSVSVSCMLTVDYVQTGVLSATMTEIGDVKAELVIHLPYKHGGLFNLLLRAKMQRIWLAWNTPKEVMNATYTVVEDALAKPPMEDAPVQEPAQAEPTPPDAEQATVQQSVSDAVNAILDGWDIKPSENAPDVANDFELQRFIRLFSFCRESGCTLKVIPNTPEENAPVFSNPTWQAVA
ncbi:hypothetical protein RFF05_13975 [Bengtsoniella intestinalis]|uniref:hypothetical protein n=1 Tax=Bengtsoniella intestinalis TaxID=3073143 RepID=UPI00391F8F6F